MNERELSLLAYRVCREILRVIATTRPSEIRSRIEDVIHDALVEFRDAIRRVVRREHADKT
jgi:hypothetical protein